ncbi:MAG: hypothetical protein M0R70_07515 [Nitrospirae bacterium]|nr:hypothetical protein [Nitrospirota bacterium]
MSDPNWPANPDLNWIKKTDDELISIINSDNMTVPNDMKNAARSELHKRKKRIDNRMLLMTLIILLLTAYLAYREYFRKTPSDISAPISTHENTIKIANPSEKKQAPQDNSDIAHSSTSTK